MSVPPAMSSMCMMGLVRSILLVFRQRSLELRFSLGGVEERAKCGLALAGRLLRLDWGFVRPLGERTRSPVSSRYFPG